MTSLCVFLCVFVQGSVGTGVQVLSVSHSGIKLLKTVKSSAAAPDYFRVLRPYTYERFLFLLRIVVASHMSVLLFRVTLTCCILFIIRRTIYDSSFIYQLMYQINL